MTQLRIKRLIIRLSSMGDVVLATSALGALASAENHWVVAKEYAGLLKGHPRLARVWEFDRKNSNLVGWLEMCSLLWKEGFTEVLDLHCTWRSSVARLYFLIRSKLSRQPVLWKRMSKERIRLNGLFVSKALWPSAWNPTPLAERSARLAGGNGGEKPDLSYLVQPEVDLSQELLRWIVEYPEYVCVMPSSKWDGKKWPVRGFFEVLANLGLPAVILGETSDRESHLLVKTLTQANLPHFDGVGKLSFKQLASTLSRSLAYLGNDTGLAHVAEAVGTSVVTVFGPTAPKMGFGPWRPTSRAVGVDLWCRPCGKDGRTCYRWGDRYACQRKVTAARVARELETVLGRNSQVLR